MKAFLLAACLSLAAFWALAASPADAAQAAQLRALGKSLPDSALNEAGVRAAILRGRADGSIDLGSMPIEDAVMLMFMLLSQDAEADMRSLLEEMDATRKDRQALRENAGRMADEARKQRSELQRIHAGRYPVAVIQVAPARPAMPMARPPLRIDAARVPRPPKPELGETESLRLQMAMDRVSKFMTALSNLEKKASDTDSAIIDNMK